MRVSLLLHLDAIDFVVLITWRRLEASFMDQWQWQYPRD
jgi:hypothetical protein